MKHTIKLGLISALLLGSIFIFSPVQGAHFSEKVSGQILLQVENNGEAWYVYPPSGERHYLGRPTEAFEIMKNLSLGATHDFIINTDTFPQRLSGLILLDVEQNGEAYYIYPDNLNKYYLGRPADAFNIMRNLGLGITNQDLSYIPIGQINNPDNSSLSSGRIIIDNVPFTTQAPFGNWSDQRQQDGCEESSSLMAIKWVRGESLDPQEALDEITGISDYLLETYGEYRDISSQDTISWILNDYFGYDNVTFRQNIRIIDIEEEIKAGHLILVPMNGQLMHNPYFSAPGPPRHMVVVKGYDGDKNTFITNDPGTKHGEDYEYDVDVFYNAIRDYPTGYHELINKVEKNIIVISK